MEVLWQAATIVAVVIGTAFSVVGVVGMVRLPDVYARLHATGKVSVFGVVLLLVAAIAWTPLAIPPAVVLIGLLLIAGPVTSHAVASAAYRLGIPPRRLERDDLAAALRDVSPRSARPVGPASDFASPAEQDRTG
jgi:multicomponent Na+:H+ antiporter subunit G